ncbi:MAG TPA: hypothetical protein VG013_31995 [Gemmataceae bacterium]|nr:hypothetical protein [Gemmataceae bacterium]
MLVDVRQKTAAPGPVPKELVGKIGLDNPAVTPDGAHVFTQGDLFDVYVHMCSFSLKGGRLMYEEAEGQICDVRFRMRGSTPDNTARITFSPDSKLV